MLDGIVGLLSVVDEVLQQEGKHAGPWVLLVDILDGGKGTALIEDGHQTLVVALFDKDIGSLCLTVGLVEGTRIDVAHHVLIDGLDILGGSTLPELDILSMALQQHVGTHVKQGMLTAQLGAQLRAGIGADRLQRGLALSQLFLGGIVPMVVRHIAAALQITGQFTNVALHQGVVLLLSDLRNFVLVKPEPLRFG